MNSSLGSVERAFAGIQLGLQSSIVAGFGESLLDPVPALVGADALLGARAELDDDLVESEVGVHVLEKRAESRNLRPDLFRGAEDVGVVLDEAAHAHDAVQRARRLVAHARPEFGDTQGQFAVRAQALIEDLDVARAVHGLDREHPLLGFGHEHVFLVLVPVP